MSGQCSTCEFYCTVPPNAGKCNVKLTYVSSQYRCANFTRKIDRSAVTFTSCHTYSDLMRSLSLDVDELLVGLDRFSAVAEGKTVDALVTESKRRYDEEQSKTCFSCGSPLVIKNSGRSRYCATCGCYLPQIIYDHRFTELVKPMKSVKPPRLGTVYTH